MKTNVIVNTLISVVEFHLQIYLVFRNNLVIR